LFGSGGTGKSTWIKQNYKNVIYINLLNPETFRKYSAKPGTLLEIVKANKDKKVVNIYEAPKFPQILDVVYKLIEEKKFKIYFNWT